MSPALTVGWLGRKFGWSGSRAQWLTLLGAVGWLAGCLVLYRLAQDWSLGQTVLAAAAWLLVLGFAGRNAVRDLFGPVFFYDLLRISRNRFTFLLRGIYVIALGAFLGLLYYWWILEQSNRDVGADGEIAAMGMLVALLVGGGLFLASRGKWPQSLRYAALIGGIVVGVILGVEALDGFAKADRMADLRLDRLPPSEVSKFATLFFDIYIWVQYAVVLLLTPVSVAGTIAIEKERKTLEFLLATDLRNREIVFGKLAARVLMLVMYVLAGLPLLAFLQLFGGIDPEQLIAVAVATIGTVVGLSALSLWVSATLKKARDAIVITYLLMIVYGLVSFICAMLVNIKPAVGLGWWRTPANVLGISLGLDDAVMFCADGNPAWALMKLTSGLRFGFLGSMTSVLREYLVFWGLATAILLTSATLKLRRTALEQAHGPVPRGRVRLHPKAGGGRAPRPPRAGLVTGLIDGTAARPALGGNPVAWKEVFVDSTFKGGCLGQLVAAVILLLAFAPFVLIVWENFHVRYSFSRAYTLAENWHRFNEEANNWVRVVTGVLGFLMFMAAALRGAGAVSGEKDRDTWISLLSTPLSSDEILRGKWWGCVLSLRRAFFVLLLVWAIGLATGSVKAVMIPVMLFLTALYVSAFSWVGIYFSLISRTTLIASVRALLAALFCAGGFWVLVGLCCFVPLSYDRSSRDFTREISSFFCGFTPPLVYGIFPLNNFDREGLGPFDPDSSRGTGLTGPILGTLFWIVFNFAMQAICQSKMRGVTNRAPRRQQREPGRRDDLENAERSREP